MLGGGEMQAKTIKMIIAYKGTSASATAKKLGKSQTNFTQMLSRDNFREQDLLAIADALGCELEITWIDKETGKEF